MPTALKFTVRHVRYWRGAIHRWSTDYSYVGSSSLSPDAGLCSSLLNLDDHMCYAGGSTEGGTYECAVYDPRAGGTALAVYTRFAWDTPGDWIGYGGAAWTTTGLDFEAAAEPCLLVEWPAGKSKTGKPVAFRKYYHAIPVSQAGSAGAHDVATADVTSLEAGAEALRSFLGAQGWSLGTPAGRLAGTGVVSPFYGSHQMPRGRRRKPLVTANGTYTGPTIKVPGPVVED